MTISSRQFVKSTLAFSLFQIVLLSPFCLPSKAFLLPVTSPMRSAITRSASRLYTRYHRPNYRFVSSSSRIFGTSLYETIPSNQELVQKRLEVAKAKKEARQKSIEEKTRRHLHIKSVIESKESKENATNGFHVPSLYALKVSVCEDLRKELNLSGRERRGRVFIELGSPATRNLNSLKFDIHAFFRALRKSSFILSAALPQIAQDGSILAPDNMNATNSWPIETDDDVAKTFAMADSFFDSTTTATATTTPLKRPSIIIHLTKDPNAPPPPPPPSYLKSMADPSQSPTMTMLSFYSFPPSGIDDPEEFAFRLKKQWKPFQALGRVYVAQEGVNAQMSVPTNA